MSTTGAPNNDQETANTNTHTHMYSIYMFSYVYTQGTITRENAQTAENRIKE